MRRHDCPHCACPSDEPTGGSLTSLENTIRRLEDKIKHENEALFELKRKRNERLPIAGLPNEILSAVFLVYRHTYADKLVPTR